MRPITWMFLVFGLLSCSGSDKGISIHNTAPIVTLTNPVEGEAFEVGEAVEFWAYVDDKESPPEMLELEWVSDVQGLLEEGTIPDSDGMASYISSSLDEGVHTVTIKATDLFGKIGSDYMTVRIESNCLEYMDCDDDGDGYTEDEGDCDDADEDRHPGAEEYYNEIDDDCDGIIDEGTSGYDDDGDGHSELDGDCDDADATVFPGAEEIADGIDNDCDDLIDEGTDAYDDDGDGYSEDEGDCDDTDASISPEAEEIPNWVDDDCDGLIDEGTDAYDDDGDGFSELEGDCDDTDFHISPIAVEVVDGIDNDCDGLIDEGSDIYDDDGDGYSEAEGDCDDTDPDVSPEAIEVLNGIDDDCDGLIDEGSDIYDDDGDGYSEADGDCDDTDPEIHPTAVEECDDIDNDCDGNIDEDDPDTDQDEDGYSACDFDCDDDDPDVHPDAPEVCDEIDNDCDEEIDADDLDTDFDEDGSSICDEEPDCNDDDELIYPGAAEICDIFGDDEDCDGLVNESGADGSVIYYLDADGDGYGTADATGLFCSLPEGYASNDDDCDDSRGSVNPTGTEVCGDGLDNDCDGETDADDSDTDKDADGSSLCDEVPDCDDENENIHPGATEICDLLDVDEDCDGLVNESGAEGSSTYFADVDGDGFGDPDSTGLFCTLADGYVNNDDDCDDTRPDVNPDGTEACGDALDNDCDGYVDADDPEMDQDEDGYNLCDTVPDCDDGNPSIHPGAVEICDLLGVDEDCDGTVNEPGAEGSVTYFIDSDGDGYGDPDATGLFCSMSEGYATNNQDCDDTRASVNPEGTEACGDGLDNDCDGFTDAADAEMDQDGDGSSICDATPDCDDTNASIYPGGTEICDPLSVDEDCDGLVNEEDAEGSVTYFADVDGDGYGNPAVSGEFCAVPVGYATNDQDCDDMRAAVSPDGTEACGDGLDNDCDGFTDADDPEMDQDGDGSTLCDADPDCDDDNDSIYPGGVEVCDLLGVDEDCDGAINEAGAEGSSLYFMDGDDDGYGVSSSFALFCSMPVAGYADNATDCNDANPSINPGAAELCGDGVDNDCDGATDGYDPDTDADGDGYSACAPIAANIDCDDTKPDVSPAAMELCGDGIDNDCDGYTDEAGGLGSSTFYADSDADGYGNPSSSVEACTPPVGYVTNNDDCNDSSSAIKPGATEVCDGIDNNCDGDTDMVGVVGAPTWYYDGDGDGFGSTAQVACDAPSGDYITVSGDCNDDNATAYPGATEYCDGILNDCDAAEADGWEAVDQTQWYRDYDGDGYPRSTSPIWACDKPSGYLPAASVWDCDDYDYYINAGSLEVCGDGEDNDCDTKVDEPGASGCTTYYEDNDGDGYGSTESMCLCSAGDVSDYDVTNNTDCYDKNSAAKPTTTAYYTSNRGDGSYDYNCVSGEEERWPYDDYKRGSCKFFSGGLGCVGDAGWSGRAPSCGSDRTWYYDCHYEWDWLDSGCYWKTTTRKQQCR